MQTILILKRYPGEILPQWVEGSLDHYKARIRFNSSLGTGPRTIVIILQTTALEPV